jgi:hypothetical protein
VEIEEVYVGVLCGFLLEHAGVLFFRGVHEGVAAQLPPSGAGRAVVQEDRAAGGCDLPQGRLEHMPFAAVEMNVLVPGVLDPLRMRCHAGNVECPFDPHETVLGKVLRSHRRKAALGAEASLVHSDLAVRHFRELLVEDRDLIGPPHGHEAVHGDGVVIRRSVIDLEHGGAEDQQGSLLGKRISPKGLGYRDELSAGYRHVDGIDAELLLEDLWNHLPLCP